MHALYGLVVIALGLGVALLVGWGVHAASALFGRGVVRALAEAVVLLALATLVAYGIGVLSKFPKDWSDPCPDRDGVALVRVDDDALPLARVCVWEDGWSVDQVPGYTNPLVFTLLGLTGASALLLVGAIVRDRAAGGGQVGRSRDREAVMQGGRDRG
jgi:hypothetical protein